MEFVRERHTIDHGKRYKTYKKQEPAIPNTGIGETQTRSKDR